MDINLASKYGVASTELADKFGIAFTGDDGGIYTIWIPESDTFTPGDLENVFLTAASLVRAHPRYRAATPTAETEANTQIQTAPNERAQSRLPNPAVAEGLNKP